MKQLASGYSWGKFFQNRDRRDRCFRCLSMKRRCLKLLLQALFRPHKATIHTWITWGVESIEQLSWKDLYSTYLLGQEHSLCCIPKRSCHASSTQRELCFRQNFSRCHFNWKFNLWVVHSSLYSFFFIFSSLILPWKHFTSWIKSCSGEPKVL